MSWNGIQENGMTPVANTIFSASLFLVLVALSTWLDRRAARRSRYQ